MQVLVGIFKCVRKQAFISNISTYNYKTKTGHCQIDRCLAGLWFAV